MKHALQQYFNINPFKQLAKEPHDSNVFKALCQKTIFSVNQTIYKISFTGQHFHPIPQTCRLLTRISWTKRYWKHILITIT